MSSRSRPTRVLQILEQVAAALLEGLAYRWAVNLIKLARRFCQSLRGTCRYLRQGGTAKGDPDRCTTVHSPAFHRPDPCIYDQYYLMSLGLAVTWDNPDITLLRNGTPVTETQLFPNTEYTIRATIWNNSYEAPVVGMPVQFSFLSFGIATISTPIAATTVDLGVKGGPGQPAVAEVPWITPPTPGHYCIQVQFECFDDANPDNNLGQNNTQVVPASSPATFSFTLRNDTNGDKRYSFEFDTYTIPPLSPCPATRVAARISRTERLRELRERNDRANFPIPPGWTIDLSPETVTLAAGEERVIAVDITPAATFHGQQPFNVAASHQDGYAGGVSLLVTKD
jgi:hypothetical protein